MKVKMLIITVLILCLSTQALFPASTGGGKQLDIQIVKDLNEYAKGLSSSDIIYLVCLVSFIGAGIGFVAFKDSQKLKITMISIMAGMAIIASATWLTDTLKASAALIS